MPLYMQLYYGKYTTVTTLLFVIYLLIILAVHYWLDVESVILYT